ncbi:MAG: ketopantoate reductase family protein [Chromatiales bacterium]|nr:ketopantoate reductase family protein [Chromatiales bacterium]
MKVLILGAGAVGLSIAARLSTVCSVDVLCRPRHAAVIQERGFELTGIWGDGVFPLSALTEVPAENRYDYCIISAKSQSTRELCEAHKAILAKAAVVSLQNGIGNEEIISEYSSTVIGGTIITGFEWRGDAQVHATVEAGPIRLGTFPNGMDQAAEQLVTLFKQAGLNVEASNNIQSNIWAKTLYNCALNPLGAILDVPYGELAHPTTWHIIEQLIGEAFQVSQQEQITLPWQNAQEYLTYLQEVQIPVTAEHHSSMLQDIRRGYTTEIDFINGAITRLGKTHGVATPVNDTLVNQIKFISRGS